MIVIGITLYSASFISSFILRRPNDLFYFFFFKSIRPPPRPTLFPYPTLFRSAQQNAPQATQAQHNHDRDLAGIANTAIVESPQARTAPPQATRRWRCWRSRPGRGRGCAAPEIGRAHV